MTVCPPSSSMVISFQMQSQILGEGELRYAGTHMREQRFSIRPLNTF